MDIAEEMKEVYAVYCRNHDDAISLVEKVCQHKLELELNDMIGRSKKDDRAARAARI